MFNLLYYLQSLKWILPATFMIGTAPNYFLVWSAWRIMTILLPEKIYAFGDDILYSLYQRHLLFFFENYSGVQVVLYGDVDSLFKKKENVVLICNHQCTVDWLIADMLGVRQGSIGHIRYILKDALKYLPLYGYYFRQHSCIYVRRSGKFQQNKAAQQLEQLNASGIPFWMVIFPEGTRFNPKSKGKSQQFARERGLPVFDYVLTPRHKATQLCLEKLHDRVDAVYDVTIAYSNTTDKVSGERINAPGLVDFLLRRSRQLHIHINRIDIQDVPISEEGVKAWLSKRFLEKEKMLQKFYASDSENQGNLGERGRVSPLSLKYTLPPIAFFTAVNLPMVLIAEGRFFYPAFMTVASIFGCAWMSVRS